MFGPRGGFRRRERFRRHGRGRVHRGVGVALGGGDGGGDGGGGDVVDDLRGEGVVVVHEAEVGLEGGGRVGRGFWGPEDAGRVGGQGRFDGGGQGVQGGGVGGVEGDDEAAGSAGGGGRGVRGRQGGGDFGEDADFAQGGDGEDHCFEGFGLRVDAYGVVAVVVAAVVAAGLGVVERGEGEGGFGVVLGVVWAWRWAHCERAVDAGAHEVGAGEGLAPLAGGEGEGRRRIVGGPDGGVGGVGHAATLGIWASRRNLARFRALEARRGLSGVLALVPWGAQGERCNIGCRWAMAVSGGGVARRIAGRRAAQTSHEAAGARGGVGRLVWGVWRRWVRESRTRHHGGCGDAAPSALLAPALVAFSRVRCGTGDGAVAGATSWLISVVRVLLLVAEFLFLIEISTMCVALGQIVLLPLLAASNDLCFLSMSFSSGRR